MERLCVSSYTVVTDLQSYKLLKADRFLAHPVFSVRSCCIIVIVCSMHMAYRTEPSQTVSVNMYRVHQYYFPYFECGIYSLGCNAYHAAKAVLNIFLLGDLHGTMSRRSF